MNNHSPAYLRPEILIARANVYRADGIDCMTDLLELEQDQVRKEARYIRKTAAEESARQIRHK